MYQIMVLQIQNLLSSFILDIHLEFYSVDRFKTARNWNDFLLQTQINNISSVIIIKFGGYLQTPYLCIVKLN